MADLSGEWDIIGQQEESRMSGLMGEELGGEWSFIDEPTPQVAAPQPIAPPEQPPGFMQKLAGAAEQVAGQPPWSTIPQVAAGLTAGVGGFLKETLFERPVNMWMQFADGLNYDFEEMMKQPNVDYMLFNLIDQTGRTFKESWKDIDWDNIERITEYERSLAHYEVTDPAARATLEFIGVVPLGIYEFFNQTATLAEFTHPELMKKYPSVGAAVRTIGNLAELRAFAEVFKTFGTRGYKGIEYTPKELGVIAKEIGEIPRMLPQPKAFAGLKKPSRWPFDKVTPEERAAFRGEAPPFVQKISKGEKIPPSVSKISEAASERAANVIDLAARRGKDITEGKFSFDASRISRLSDELKGREIPIKDIKSIGSRFSRLFGKGYDGKMSAIEVKELFDKKDILDSAIVDLYKRSGGDVDFISKKIGKKLFRLMDDTLNMLADDITYDKFRKTDLYDAMISGYRKEAFKISKPAERSTAERAEAEISRPELANERALDITRRVGEWEVDKTKHDIDALEAEALSLHKRVSPEDFKFEGDFNKFITGVENVLSHIRKIKRRDMSPLEEPSPIQINPRPLASGEEAGRVVYNADGKPFHNEATAQAWTDLTGIEGMPVENPVGDGWVIVRKAEPYVSKISVVTPEAIAKELDITYNGKMGVPGKEIHLFTDPETKGTFSLSEPTLESVSDMMKLKRVEFGEPSPMADSTNKIGGAINKTLKDALNEKGEVEVPEVLVRGVRSIREFFNYNTWADPRSEVYKNTSRLVDDRRIAHNLSAFDAIDMRESLMEILPEAGERRQIPYYVEGETVSVSPAMEFTADIWVQARRHAKEALIEAGSKAQEDFLEGYIPHIIVDPLQTHEAVSWMRRRVRKPGGLETFKIRELEEAGFKLEKDIAKIAPLYMYHVGRVIGNKVFADGLRHMKNPAGDWVILKESEMNRKTALTHIPLDAETLNRWSGFAKRHTSKTGEDIRPDLFRGRTFVDRNSFMPINGIISTFTPEIYGKLAKLRVGVKRVIMYNPLIHGVNIESNVIMGVGFRKYFTKEHFAPTRMLSKADIVKDKALLREMVANGMQLEGLYDIGRRLGADIFELRDIEKITWKDVHKDPRLLITRPIGVLKGLGDEILWDKWVKTGQISLYNVLKDRFVRDGLGIKEAGRAAAMMSNDLMGTLPTNWFTKNQRNVLRTLMFARNWNVSNMRTLTGALPKELATSRLLPKPLRFEGMTDAQLKAMGKQYRYVLLRGAIGITVTANAIQAAFLEAHGQPFHSIWENEDGHKFDIDTGRVDTQGRRVYFKDHLFRQIDDYIKLLTKDPIGVAKAKSEPLLRTLIEGIFNVDYRGEKIRKRGMTIPEKITAEFKHIVAGVTPLDTFVRDEDEIRNWRDSLLVLTGTWIRRGMPAGGDAVAANILKDFYEYHARGEYQRSKAEVQISKLIQLGRSDEAITKTISAVRQHQLSPKAFQTIMMKLKMPFLYRISMAGKKIRPEFLRFIFTLPKAKREEYLNRISGTRSVLRTPRLQAIPTPQALEREESLGGEWSIVQ